MIRSRASFAFAAILAFAFAAPQRASAGDAYAAEMNKEYMVKAAFIYNFVKFVEWPDAKSIGKQSNIDICVLGDSPMLEAGHVFQSASTPKLKLSLVRENSIAAVASHCHILFLATSQQERLGEVHAALKGQPVLIVGDKEGFIDRGGMIGFVSSDNKVKLEVNIKAVSAAGMRVDAQLLEIAKRVVDK